MEFKAYHKIRQFKDIVRDIQHQANFKGLDEDGEAIYEESPKPAITFKGTVKLHGTNAGICYSPKTGISAQKRSSLLNKEDVGAHMGFNVFVNHTERSELDELMLSLWKHYCLEDEQITLYGEWAGKGIQKGIGVSELSKAFYIFDCKVFDPTTEEGRWIDISELRPDIDNVYNIHQFETYSINIDFNTPQLFQERLAKITEKVEMDCPVARQLLGKDCNIEITIPEASIVVPSGTKLITQREFKGKLIGEGVVWTGFWNDNKYIFKVKGEKHSSTKVKTLASIDPEVVKSVYAFIAYACTQNRVDQGIQEVDAKEKSDMPKLLKWVANDIMSEEATTLKDNNLEWKQVAGECNNRVRQLFFAKLDKI